MLLRADDDDLRIWRQKSASRLAGALSVNANTNRSNFRASCQAMKSSIRSIGCMRTRPASGVPLNSREPRAENLEPENPRTPEPQNPEPRTQNENAERRTPNPDVAII